MSKRTAGATWTVPFLDEVPTQTRLIFGVLCWSRLQLVQVTVLKIGDGCVRAYTDYNHSSDNRLRTETQQKTNATTEEVPKVKNMQLECHANVNR